LSAETERDPVCGREGAKPHVTRTPRFYDFLQLPFTAFGPDAVGEPIMTPSDGQSTTL
jgi:hypothetical protein